MRSSATNRRSDGALLRARADTSVPAVVLKLDANVFHHGGLGVIRSLGRLGIPVYGVHEDHLAPAARSRYLRGRWYRRPGAAEDGRVIDGLRTLSRRIGRPAVLIPTDDEGAILVAEHRDELREAFLVPDQPRELPRRLAAKDAMAAWCRDLGVPHLASKAAHTTQDLRDFADRAGFPVVAKVAEAWGHKRPGGPRSTTIVRTWPELRSLHDQCRGPGGAQLLLQEYIPGGRGHDWFFHGYSDGRARCLQAFTGVKVRSYPPHAGLTCLGRVARNDRLRHEAESMLHASSYRGIMDLDFRYDARDDQYKLLDFNPRIGAQFRLFEDEHGVDVVRAAHLDLTGRAVPRGEAVERGFLVENYDPVAALGYLRRGELDLRGWLRSLRGVGEVAWFAVDDLAPFGLMCARLLWRSVERPLTSRLRGRRQIPQPQTATT